MPDGGCTVTIPIRIALDATVIHAVDIVEDALGSALSRAIAASFDAVVRRRSTHPVLGEPPAFRWTGDGLPLVDSVARSRVEAAVLATLRTHLRTWPAFRSTGGSSARSAVPASIPRTAVPELQPFGARAIEPPAQSWTHWLALAGAVDSGRDDGGPRASAEWEAVAAGREAVRTAAFAERFERAVPFVPDVERIVRAGFAPEPNPDGRLDVMLRELGRGFLAAFAAALERRDVLDVMTAAAVVPLVIIVTTHLAQDAFRTERISAQTLMRALGSAFPATDLRQICGMAVNVDYDRLVRRNVALEVFFEALALRGFADADAHAATVSFIHALFEALATAYRRVMLEAVEAIVAVQRAFRSNADGAQLPGAAAMRLTDAFDRAVAAIADRTPQAAVTGGRETEMVAERLRGVLRRLSARNSVWRADIRPVTRPSESARFVLALHPPELDDDDLTYYEDTAGRETLHDVLLGYAVMSEMWYASGALGLAWRTGVARLDAVLAGLVGELRADEPARASFFLDEPYG
jgi:hypothetical protein